MIDRERTGILWMDGSGAVIGRWEDGPLFEEIASEVPPKRRPVGSVRRGPARPSGGGRVGGPGTEGQHAEAMRRFFTTVAERLADLDAVEVSGRGPVHERFADLLGTLRERGDADLEVILRPLTRRPSPRQMAARLRKLAGEPLPRRRKGPYRPIEPDREASGRMRSPSREDFPNQQPRHLPEREAIELEIRMMLADDQPWW